MAVSGVDEDGKSPQGCARDDDERGERDEKEEPGSGGHSAACWDRASLSRARS
jgi:hypothetical protein